MLKFVSTIALLSAAATCSTPAHAQGDINVPGECDIPEPEIAGEWVNHPTRGTSYVELELGFHCDERWNLYTLHAWGWCWPNVCDWGEVDADYHHQASTERYTAEYDLGWGVGSVVAIESILHPGELWVWSKTYVNGEPLPGTEQSGYMIRRTSSCIDSCGGQAPDGCWCDQTCSFFEDCCVDKIEECGGF